MTPFIQKASRTFPWLLLVPVLLPVAIWNGLIYPYLVPKTLLFYAISLLSFAAFLIVVAYRHPFHWNRLTRKETWIPGALLIVAYIASIFGIDFYRSFWSLFIRGDGLLMFTCAIGSFYLILLSADRSFFERFLRAVAAVASFVAAYGIGEWMLGGGRIGSLLGNAAFFAGYLGIGVFLTLMAEQALSGGWRTAARWGAGLQVLAIILTATRGTMLALVVAGLASLGYLAYRGEGKAKRLSRNTLIGAVILAVLFVALRGPLSHVPFTPIARVASIGVSDPDIASRLFIWKNMTGQIAQHFWLGVGAEHIDVLFNNFYDPTQISEQWFDRSHNAFLDYFAQFGVAGFALYVMLIGTFFLTARRLWRRGETRLGGLTALLALTYAVQNFFVFDTISSFWLLLASLAVLLAASSDTPAEALAVSSWTKPASWIAAIVLIAFIYPVSIRPVHAAYDLAQGYAYAITNVPREVSYLQSGYALNTYGDMEYGYEAYDMLSNYQLGHITGNDLVTAYQEAESILKQNFDRYPYDARTALYLAQVLSVAPQGVSVDPNVLSSALARAIQESPKRYQPWYILANLSISQANENAPASSARAQGYAAAEDILRRYLERVPGLSEPHYVLAQLLYATGHTTEAAAEAAKGKQYYQGDLETAKRAVSYYETVLDLQNAQYFLEEVLRQDPTNTAAEEDLAKVKAYEQQQ